MKNYKSQILSAIKSRIGDQRYLLIRRASVIGFKQVRKLYSAPLRFCIDGGRSLGILPPLVPDKKNYDQAAAAGSALSIAPGGLDLLTIAPTIDGLTIITLNLNGEKFLEDYLKGLLHLPSIAVQLIFVDHNSSDKSLEMLARYEQILNIELLVIRKATNDTYSKSNNDALAQAKYGNILLLNNDVVITEHSNIYLALQHLNSNQSIGVIGWQLFYDSELKEPQHEGISFVWDCGEGFYRPTNISGFKRQRDYGAVIAYPAVTAAIALARQSDLIEIGGLDESYNYGYEDVDLCLALSEKLDKKSVTIEGLSAVHPESLSQKRTNRVEVRGRRRSNIKIFQNKFGYALAHKNRRALLSKSNPYDLKKTRIGFVVTEAFDQATAGDYFTALELSIALRRETACEIEFFPQRGPNTNKKPNCNGVDLLIVMIDRFDIRDVRARFPNTIVVAWMRNWFDRWHSWPYFGDFDQYWTSSEHAQHYMAERCGVDSSVIRIGTNVSRFYAPITNVSRDIDVSFVGSKWNVPRDIETVFPVLRKYKTKIYGHGWDEYYENSDMFPGSIEYNAVPSIYAQSKIIIDDAASSTIHWHSVNSRVFDALAAGCMVLTNGSGGANELSELDAGVLSIPTYNNLSELEALLDKYLSDDDLRIRECKVLQQAVVKHHSYRTRAQQAISGVREKLEASYAIAIKVPVPDASVKHQWGDYHFAESLKLAFKKLGHQVRIDLMPDWYGEHSNADEVIIVLRGLSAYIPNPNQVNIMWNISHPDKVSEEEYSDYDCVFVASNSYAEKLSKRLANIKPLLQCTDPYRFFPEDKDQVPSHDLLFVGNSRKVYRDVVRFSIELDYPVSIYGGLWDELIPSEYIKGQNIDNSELRHYYSSAKVVLNDHWQTMRENGFISNRLFDVVASGGVVVSDYVAGAEELFGQSVVFFDGSKDGFKNALKIAQNVIVNKEDIAYIAENHSFDARAFTIISEVESHAVTKLNKWRKGISSEIFD
jgi:spore maturation protein CgeB/GT2 family glycosyltransferase